MEKAVQDLKLVLLDFDGTIYRFTEEFERHCHEVAVETALTLCGQFGVSMTRGEAMVRAEQSYKDFGSSFAVFQKEYKFSTSLWHDLYHQRLEQDYVHVDPLTVAGLRACPLPLAVLSHSNRGWVNSAIKRFGMDGIIPPERVFGLEDVGFNFKSQSEEPYRIVLDKTGFLAGQTAMVEDSLLNLIPAKNFGMKTVHITHGRAFDPAAHDYVDYVCDDLAVFMKALVMALPARVREPGARPDYGMAAG
ncbi:MAG: HAD hydrolase-like protein [Alphaproteobacteria bacterium]|nr:HAD hydrolase-like protein [Alphaproteobacteria bacterium]